ncbi:hypothetical protein [Neobacillus sp. Marseille-QA0830]
MWKTWFVILFFSIFLVGCSGGSYAIRTGELTSSTNSMSGNYTKFTGYYFREVKFAKGDEIHFDYSVLTKSGSLAATVVDSSGKKIADIHDDETINIPKEDTYKIRVNGDGHKGSFNIMWDVAKN